MYLPSDFSIPSELGTMIFSLNNLKILDVNDGKVIFNTNLILENNSLNQMGLSEFDLNTLQTNSLGSIRLSLSESILFNSLKLIHFKGNHYIYTTLTSDSCPYYIWKVQNNNTSQFYSRPSGGLLYSFIEFENNLYFGYTNFGFDIKHLLLKSDGNTINTYRLSGGVLNYTQFRNIGVPFLAGGKLIFWVKLHPIKLSHIFISLVYVKEIVIRVLNLVIGMILQLGLADKFLKVTNG